MPQSSQPDTAGGLVKLPIDVLLKIFDGCDVADILNLALICKELRAATEERHVWLTQFKRHCAAFRQAPFHSRTKELHVHSTAQLRSWTIQQTRTDALWLQGEGPKSSLKLQTVRTNKPQGVGYLDTFLLPGGEHLVAFTTNGDIILKKIERGNDSGNSDWVLTDVARCSLSSSGPVKFSVKVFTDTVCEYPLIAFHNWEDASVTIFCLDHDSRMISVQKEIRANTHYKPVDYLMRYFGIRGDTIMWFYKDHDGESREHLIVGKLDDPDGAATRHLDLDWDAETSRVSRFEVITANAFIRYNHFGIDLYYIPHLPSGIQSQGGNSKPQLPSPAWSFHGGGALVEYSGIYYDRTDAALPTFYLRDECSHMIIEFGMDTPADAEHDPCVRYPVVLNHTVTPVDGNHSGGIAFRWSKGRRAGRIYVGFEDELHLKTVLVDDPNRSGYFCIDLRQNFWPLLIDAQWIETMEYDEVTGRILLVSGDISCQLLLTSPATTVTW